MMSMDKHWSNPQPSVCSSTFGQMIGKGQMGSALMGSLQISCFFTGTFWVLPLIYFCLPKNARAYLFFSQSVKTHYFCFGPISVDPIGPQPTHTSPQTSVPLAPCGHFCSWATISSFGCVGGAVGWWQACTPTLLTKIIPAKICWLKMSWKFRMDMRIPPLKLRLCLSQSLWNPES